MTNIFSGAALLLCAAVGGGTAQAADSAPSTLAAPTFAFEEIVTLAGNVDVGRTAVGGRNFIPITGGTFEGPGLKGTILPGGWDWQLQRADGCTVLKADYMIKTDDGVIINVVNQGVACPPAGGQAYPIRTTPVFEVPRGKYEWLAQRTFTGTVEGTTVAGAPAVRLRFYQVN